MKPLGRLMLPLDIFFFCIRQFALHCQQPAKHKQNVDFAPPGKISADAHDHSNYRKKSGFPPHVTLHDATKVRFGCGDLETSPEDFSAEVSGY